MEDSQHQQDLRFTVWQFVDRMARQEAAECNKSLSTEFVASLADIVYKQMETLALDLEHFARHGKRSTISMEDVKLCARRNDSLYELISDIAKEIAQKPSAMASSSKRKKKD